MGTYVTILLVKCRNANIVFRTVRPADYSTPYDTMLKNGVQFTAVEKQQSILFTFAVSTSSKSPYALVLPCF